MNCSRHKSIPQTVGMYWECVLQMPRRLPGRWRAYLRPIGTCCIGSQYRGVLALHWGCQLIGRFSVEDPTHASAVKPRPARAKGRRGGDVPIQTGVGRPVPRALRTSILHACCQLPGRTRGEGWPPTCDGDDGDVCVSGTSFVYRGRHLCAMDVMCTCVSGTAFMCRGTVFVRRGGVGGTLPG